MVHLGSDAKSKNRLEERPRFLFWSAVAASAWLVFCLYGTCQAIRMIEGSRWTGAERTKTGIVPRRGTFTHLAVRRPVVATRLQGAIAGIEDVPV